MALNANDLASDIKNDTEITNSIPPAALQAFNNFADRISVHITEQIKRGVVDDVKVDTGSGSQTNEANIK